MKRIIADSTAKKEPVGQMWKTGSLFLSKRNGVETMQFICYSRCGTCQKAKKYLTEHEIPYEERDIKSENPTEEELNIWIEKSGLPSRKFFNTSGKLYKEMELSKKLPDMTKEEQDQEVDHISFYCLYVAIVFEMYKIQFFSND